MFSLLLCFPFLWTLGSLQCPSSSTSQSINRGIKSLGAEASHFRLSEIICQAETLRDRPYASMCHHLHARSHMDPFQTPVSPGPHKCPVPGASAGRPDSVPAVVLREAHSPGVLATRSPCCHGAVRQEAPPCPESRLPLPLLTSRLPAAK